MADPPLKICVQCGKCAEKMSKCSTCVDKFRRRTYYCGQECQKKDWPSHKLTHKERGNADSLASHITGLAINDADEQGMTILMRKSLEGDFEEVVRLIGDGADVTISESQGLTALHYALSIGRQDIVEFFLDNGSSSLLQLVTAPPRRESLLSFASRLPHAAVVAALIRKGGSALLQINSTPEVNALSIACTSSNPEILKLIIDADRAAGGALVRECGPAALLCACIFRRPDAVKQLLEAGGERILRTSSHSDMNPHGFTSLMVASRSGDLESVRLLSAAGGAELLLRTTNCGANCLLLALREGHISVARNLLSLAGGAGLVSVECLRWACELGDLDTVKLLVEAAGAGALLRPLPSGATCLFIAAQAAAPADAQSCPAFAVEQRSSDPHLLRAGCCSRGLGLGSRSFVAALEASMTEASGGSRSFENRSFWRLSKLREQQVGGSRSFESCRV